MGVQPARGAVPRGQGEAGQGARADSGGERVDDAGTLPELPTRDVRGRRRWGAVLCLFSFAGWVMHNEITEAGNWPSVVVYYLGVGGVVGANLSRRTPDSDDENAFAATSLTRVPSCPAN